MRALPWRRRQVRVEPPPPMGAECPCCCSHMVVPTQGGKKWRCVGCGSRGVMLAGEFKVLRAAAGTGYFQDWGGAFRDQVRADREKAIGDW